MVTGAGSGLGEGAAAILARESATVVVSDINCERGREVAQRLGAPAIFLELDTRDEGHWARVLAEIITRFGRLDILVNNAGVPSAGYVTDMSLEYWRSIMAINLDGVFLGVKHAIEAMKKTGGGSIINMSSVAGIVGTPGLAAYSASKAGVKLLTKCAALECAEQRNNIRVNSVHPGIIRTPGADRIFALLGNGDAAVGEKYIVGLHPIGRMGRVEDIANGILYLASDESSFVTGSELVIDGGMTAD